jgi:hypothetical protein
MKNLNSVILEGIIVSNPCFTPDPTPVEQSARFLLDIDVNSVAIPVLAKHRLAVTCRDRLRTGMSIRTVGRIGFDTAEDAMQVVVIQMEHIEIKPERPAQARQYAEEAIDAAYD